MEKKHKESKFEVASPETKLGFFLSRIHFR